MLFNFYIATIPSPPPGICVTTYADDITIQARAVNPDDACARINDYLERLNAWMKERRLTLSPGKSTASISTTCTQDFSKRLQVKVDNFEILVILRPKILGVTFDPLLKFHAHAEGPSLVVH